MHTGTDGRPLHDHHTPVYSRAVCVRTYDLEEVRERIIERSFTRILGTVTYTLLKDKFNFFEKSSFAPPGASGRQVIAENNEFLKNHISYLNMFFWGFHQHVYLAPMKVFRKPKRVLVRNPSRQPLTAFHSYEKPIRVF
jgi:hypothetical protein